MFYINKKNKNIAIASRVGKSLLGRDLGRTFCFLLFTFSLSAQSRWGITANFGNQKSVFAFTNASENVYHKELLHPSFQVGAVRKHFISKRGNYWFQDFTVGYVHLTYEEKIFSASTQTGYTWALWNRILLSPSLGIGYNLAQPNDVRYALESDKWVRTKNDLAKKNRASFTGAISVGYRLRPSSPNPIDLTATAQYTLVTPYSKELQIPIWLYSNVNIGAKYFF